MQQGGPRNHGQREAECATRERERQTLGQQLPDQPSAARSQRLPDTEFADARRRTAQLQIGHVGTNDQKQHAHGGEQHRHCGALFLCQGVVETNEPHAHFGVRVGIHLLQAARNGCHLPVGMFEGDAMAEAGDHIQIVRPPVFDKNARLEPERNVDLLIMSGKEKVARHHTDDVIGFSGQRDGAPDDMRVARKFGLPEIVAEDGDAALALEGFFISEGSSE